MLWLAAYLPALPLEVFECTLSAHGPMAVSVYDGGPRILLCNKTAAGRGVRPGLGVGSAQALVAGLRILGRDVNAEQEALRRLAGWARQYTSQISLEPPQTLLLEVAGSVKLFGSIGTILRRLRAGMERLGYTARLAVAPTPQGAVLLARAGRQDVITDGAALRSVLAPLPLSLLPFDRPVSTALQNMGLYDLADLWRLPRQGLRRRLGTLGMDYMERLLGGVPDPRPLFQPPPGFSGRVSLPVEVKNTEALLFACRRLILEMCGYLSAQSWGTQRLDWSLEHVDKAETRWSQGLLNPERSPAYLGELLRERLERVELTAAVVGVRLTAGEIQSLGTAAGELFAVSDPAPERDPNRLLERLRVRLGDEAVHGLRLLPEHRPERAWAWCFPGASAPLVQLGERPLWLLAKPRPLEVRAGWPWLHGPLELDPERERIESGWWDGDEVARDYFVARRPDGERVWIYRELNGTRQWFLHGFWG